MLRRLLGEYIHRAFRDPVPLRYRVFRRLARQFDLLTYADKLRWNLIDRPHYGHCLLESAQLAKRLEIPRISAIEFGVGGGDGLVSIERHAKEARRETGVDIAVYGFDSGSGLPQPEDYRDMPYLWEAGDYAMDVEGLRQRLESAQLILGQVDETLPDFCSKYEPPPIGFISFDLDYYSSTAAAMRILEADHRFLLPRISCYFDDMVGGISTAYNVFAGEMLAVTEFNDSHTDLKVAPVLGMRFSENKVPALWHEQIFVAHVFRHPLYSRLTRERRETSSTA